MPGLPALSPPESAAEDANVSRSNKGNTRLSDGANRSGYLYLWGYFCARGRIVNRGLMLLLTTNPPGGGNLWVAVVCAPGEGIQYILKVLSQIILGGNAT